MEDNLLSEVSSEYIQMEEESSPEDDFLQQNPVGLDLINHPVFSILQDEILEMPIQYLKSLAQKGDSQEGTASLSHFEDKLLSFVFKDQEAIDTLKGQEIIQKSVCGRYFTTGDIYVQCLDCSLDCPYSVPSLCMVCFDQANHENHRLIFTRKEDASSGTCDCGDTTFIKPEGFCPEHAKVKADVETQIQKFPNGIRERYHMIIKKILYVVCSAMELFQYTQSSKIWKFGELLLSKLLKLCEVCQEEINEAFPLIVAQVLQERFLESYDVLLHNCEETFQSTIVAISKEPKSPCKCSLLGNLFRIGNLISKDQQTQLEKLLVDGTKLPKFKSFLAIEFAKFLDFLYAEGGFKRSVVGHQTSALLNLGFQIFHQEEQIEAVYKSGYLKNITEVMKRFIYRTPKLTYDLYKIMNSLNGIVDYFQQSGRAIGERIIKESSLISDLLETLRSFQIKFVYSGEIKLGIFEHLVDFKHLTYSVMVEKMLYNSLETILGIIAGMPEEERRSLTKAFAFQWFREFELLKAAINEEDRQQGFRSFSCGLERVFACFIQTQRDDVLPDLNPEEVLEEILRTFGVIRYFHQTMDGITFNMLKSCYYHIGWNYFEIDVLLIQQMLWRIGSSEKIMKVLVKNFFSYSPELQKFFEDPGEILTTDFYPKQQLIAIQDFLNFLVFLMTDELCALNFDLNLNKAYGKAPPVLSPQQKHPIENLVVNFLLGSYWTTLPELKKGLESMLASTDYLEEIIAKVSVFDEKTQKIRIKDEFLKDTTATTADVYMFYKDPVKKQEILSGIISKSKKGSEIDIVSGGSRVLVDLPQILQDIQVKFFLGTLPKFLSQFIQQAGSSGETEKFSSALGSVLRLVLLNFQVADLKGKEVPDLLAKLEQNYFTPDFEENLKKLIPSFQDCKQCIEKILALKLQLATDSEEAAEIPITATTMITEAVMVKNLAAKERMRRVQEEFLKKQAKFAEKNIDTMEEEEILTAEKASLQCQHCLEYIQEEAADYGLPVFINFTNNLCGLTPDRNYSWWPVLSSCNHYYHRDCYKKLFENNGSQKPFYGRGETCCTLCKTLCNFFLQVNQQGADEDFFTNIKRIFEDYSLKNQSFNDGFPEEEILKRAFDYYLQTVVVGQNDKHKLYVLFFKTAFSSLKTENSVVTSTKTETSLFSQIIKNHQDPILTKLSEILLSCRKDDLQTQYFTIIKDILAFKAVQLFSQKEGKTCVVSASDLYNISKDLSNILECSDLIGILQIVFKAFNFNQCLVGKNPTESFEKDLDLDTLLEKLGFKTNLQTLFQEAISEMTINEIDSSINNNLQLFHQAAPKIVTLPDTYAEFNSKYFRQKCVLCKGYSSHLNSCICLICGVVVCEKACDSGQKKSGNLNSHCKEHHLGTGVFLDKHHLRFVLINSPLNMRYDAKELYTDSLGQSVLKVLDDTMTVSKIDFKKFAVNKRIAEEIKRVITSCGFEKELFRILITGKEKRIRDGLL